MHSIFHRVLLTRPNKPRNPVLKVLFSALGLLVLLVVCVLAIFVGIFMLITSLLLRRLHGKPATASASADVLNAEYSVVEKSPIALPR